MSQQSVDDLLQQVQAQADAVGSAADAPAAAPAGPADDAAVPAGDFAEPPPTPAPPPIAQSSEFRRLLAIEVPVIVRLGQRRMSVGEVLRLGAGAIIEFNKSADEEMELLVNNKPVGQGHAVKVGENFGIKITQIGTVRETIQKLGGAQ